MSVVPTEEWVVEGQRNVRFLYLDACQRVLDIAVRNLVMGHKSDTAKYGCSKWKVKIYSRQTWYGISSASFSHKKKAQHKQFSITKIIRLLLRRGGLGQRTEFNLFELTAIASTLRCSRTWQSLPGDISGSVMSKYTLGNHHGGLQYDIKRKTYQKTSKLCTWFVRLTILVSTEVKSTVSCLIFFSPSKEWTGKTSKGLQADKKLVTHLNTY
jgi:hypothetical protein